MLMRGLDTQQVVRAIQVTSAGIIRVVMDNLTDTGQPLVTDGNGALIVAGYDPLPRRSGGLALRYQNLNISGGLQTYTAHTVPSGERWQINCVAVQYVGTVTGVLLYIGIRRGGVDIYAVQVSSLVSGNYYSYPIGVVIEGGDSVIIQVVNGTAGNTIRCNIFGAMI